MKKIIGVIVVVVFAIQGLSAQAGLRLYGGVSAMSNESQVLMPNGLTTGYHVGGDLRLNDGGMFFVLGGRFTQVGYSNNDAMYVTDAPNVQMVNTRVGLGFKLFNFTDLITFRAKVLGSIDYVYNTPLTSENTTPGFESYRNVNSTASMIGGIGISIGSITVDLEYGYGLFNMVSKEKDTVPTHLSLSAGFFF